MRQTALNTVFEIAKVNPRVLFIGSDLGVGTLQAMKRELPDQFMMEGISEQHIIGFAAGLAKEGFIPFVNTIANFLSRRALEQIILDIALHNLPVKILASGGGMVYAPLGPTHTATDDLAHVLAIPNLNVFSPCDAHEMKLLIQAQVSQPSPAYIRFGKGGESIVSEGLATNNDRSISYLGSIQAAKVIVTTGVALQPSLLAVMNLLNDDDVLLVHFTKVNLEFSDLLNSILDNKETVLVVEEHQSLGGLLTQILHYCHEYRLSSETIRSISLGKAFVRNYGSQADHFKTFGITPENIANELMR
jgi:transketolase